LIPNAGERLDTSCADDGLLTTNKAMVITASEMALIEFFINGF
jgi:hypothetical protein